MPHSFAASHADFASGGIRADASPTRDFRSEHRDAVARGSNMVAKDRPHPVHKPSPALSYGPDGTSFDARWTAEKRDADRAVRKAAYEQARLAPTKHFKTRSHSR